MRPRNIIVSLFAALLALNVATDSTEAQNNNHINRNQQRAIRNLIAALVNIQTGDIILVDARNAFQNANINVNVLNNALNGLDLDVLSNNNLPITVTNVLNDLSINVQDVVVAVNALGGTFIYVLP
jgi:hypothetical protein